jgi:hypothetical protein
VTITVQPQYDFSLDVPATMYPGGMGMLQFTVEQPGRLASLRVGRCVIALPEPNPLCEPGKTYTVVLKNFYATIHEGSPK